MGGSIPCLSRISDVSRPEVSGISLLAEGVEVEKAPSFSGVVPVEEPGVWGAVT